MKLQVQVVVVGVVDGKELQVAPRRNMNGREVLMDLGLFLLISPASFDLQLHNAI